LQKAGFFYFFLGERNFKSRRDQPSTAIGSNRLHLTALFNSSGNQVSQLLKPLPILDFQPVEVIVVSLTIPANTTLCLHFLISSF
jgi:hypothetical protein